MDVESLEHYFKGSREKPIHCYYSRESGIDLKISKSKIEVEFHSTFFATFYPEGYSILKRLKAKIQNSFNTYARLSRIDVAQDYINLPLEKLIFKKTHKVQFNSLERLYKNNKTNSLETIDRHDKKYTWRLTCYDKTAELKANESKSSQTKNEYYKSQGYFDHQITRVELKLKSKYCGKLIEVFESDISEKKY